MVILGALALALDALAGATSVILLSVFVLVNAALIAQKRRHAVAAFRVPMAVPVAGLSLSLLALAVAVVTGG